jgi:hypothetical protein
MGVTDEDKIADVGTFVDLQGRLLSHLVVRLDQRGRYKR